jgi:hypothetical protein
MGPAFKGFPDPEKEQAFEQTHCRPAQWPEGEE